MTEHEPAATAVPPYMLRVLAAIAPDATLSDLARALVDEWLPSQGVQATSWCRDMDRTTADGSSDPEYAPGPPPRAVLEDPTRRDLDIRIEGDDWSIFLLTYDDKRPGDRSRLSFGRRHCVSLDMKSFLKAPNAAPIGPSFRGAYDLGDWLAGRFGLLGLNASRGQNGFAPSPPHASIGVIQHLASRAAIAEAYPDPEVYWSAWPELRPLGDDRVLATRGRDIVDELAFKQATYPKQWELARAAAPGRTHYGKFFNAMSGFYVAPEEEAYFQSGQGILSATHYDAATGVVDMTAWAEPGTHIAPREIPALVRWKFYGKLDDGQPVAEIRVTFVDRAQALSQKRVLIDIGCRVFHYGATPADLVELTD